LSDFKIITKADIKQNFSDYINPDYHGKTIWEHTSGTTGGGLGIPWSEEGLRRQWAVWWRCDKSVGIKFGTWRGSLGGRTIIPIGKMKLPYWRINRPGRQVMYSSYHLNAETVKYYYDDIKKRQLTWIHGYPSATSILSALIVENGLEPIETVKWITTGAESLMEHQIEIIHKAFPNAIVHTHYGLTEGVSNLSQDKDGRWYSDEDFAYTEFIPVDEKDPTICRIVGTGFTNYAFPLVRYDTGDLAKVEWVDGKPYIIEIYGRQEESVELPNGVKLVWLGLVFKNCINIKEAQVHQIRRDLIELKVVKSKNYTEKEEELLLKEASSRFGNDVELKITYCDKIERTKAGKVRFVVSDLHK
jgi:phenylacetate-CoA ligase